MEITNVKQLTIDKVDDQVDFGVKLYNTEIYDKGRLRKVTTNTVFELTISNFRYFSINIVNLYLGILDDDRIIDIYTSTKIQEKLPVEVGVGESIRILFYAYEIKRIFGSYKGERGIFAINLKEKSDTYNSSNIKGDKLEEIIMELDEDEIGYNWGTKDFYRLDVKEKYQIH